MTILDTIAEATRLRVEQDKQRMPLDTLRSMCLQKPGRDGRPFETALKKRGMSFICEIKKASPSKGIISPDFPYLEIAAAYKAAGADCISCLTEPQWFLGSDQIFEEIRRSVSLPMLRKDFVVDEYQIYQAAVMGADAVLLICSLLNTDTIRKYLILCEELGLSALVETHDEREIASACEAGANIIGVNNRNLKDFSVDFSNAARLRDLIPWGVLYVAESGVSGPEDVAALKAAGADAALIGEALMRAKDKAAALSAMREAAK